MGISKLNSFLKKKLKDVNIFKRGIQNVHLSKYKYKNLAIDISQILYKFRHDNLIEELQIFIDKLIYFEINFIFVFDGKPSNYKLNTIKARKDNKNKLYKELIKLEVKILENKVLENEKDTIQKKINKLKINTFKITRKHISDIQNYLDSKKYKYIHLENVEGDFVCHSLYNNDIIDAIISNDMDMLLYGCPILRNWSSTANFVDEYNSTTIYNNINMSKEQFLDFILMLGCDYLPNIGKISVNDAYYLIQTFKNIETIIKKISCYKTTKELNIDEFIDLDNAQDINKERIVDIIKVLNVSNYFLENYENIKVLFKKCIVINKSMIKNYLE